MLVFSKTALLKETLIMIAVAPFAYVTDKVAALFKAKHRTNNECLCLCGQGKVEL